MTMTRIMELFAGLFIVFVGNDRPNTMVTTLDRFKLMVASKLYALFPESMQFVHPIIMNCPRWIVHVINVYCERKDHITKTNCERKDHITKLNKFKYDDETAKPNRNSLDLRDWNLSKIISLNVASNRVYDASFIGDIIGNAIHHRNGELNVWRTWFVLTIQLTMIACFHKNVCQIMTRITSISIIRSCAWAF
eukprot:714507_1